LELRPRIPVSIRRKLFFYSRGQNSSKHSGDAALATARQK
jgi:hypothetical protein